MSRIIATIITAIIGLLMLLGGIALLVYACKVSGVWPTIWRGVLGGILTLFGAIICWKFKLIR